MEVHDLGFFNIDCQMAFTEPLIQKVEVGGEICINVVDVGVSCEDDSVIGIYNGMSLFADGG